MPRNVVGTRIKALRDTHNLSQDSLATLLGINDRQTVSAIETGVRQLKAEELLTLADSLSVPLEYFTDPFRLDGESRFSWRQDNVPSDRLLEYEAVASQWIGAYRTLAPKVGRRAQLVRPSLGLTRKSQFEDANEVGERFVDEFELGKVPAKRLIETMEKSLGILVLLVDVGEGVSGAACRLPDLDAVLVARKEVAGRRNFNLAHELFHILTWEAMPPEHTEQATETSGNRVEQLANEFAAALLMPEKVIARYGQWEDLNQDALVDRLNQVASELNVTSSALRWRLSSLGKLPVSKARSIPETSLRNNGGLATELKTPSLFSRPFVEVLKKAIHQGHISTRRAAVLVNIPVEGLPGLFAEHDVEFELEL